MALSGTFEMEDLTITFAQEQSNVGQRMNVMVSGFTIDPVTKKATNLKEVYICQARDLLIALSIAIHPDGEPNVNRDYPAAERAMPKLKDLRFIP